MKYDGFRLLAGVGGGAHPVLWTRNLNVVTSSYPEVTEALTEAFGGHGRIVFDGEIVALTQGRPSFARLQKRANTLRPTTALRRQVPVTYLPFDVLYRTTRCSPLLLDMGVHRIWARPDRSSVSGEHAGEGHPAHHLRASLKHENVLEVKVFTE